MQRRYRLGNDRRKKQVTTTTSHMILSSLLLMLRPASIQSFFLHLRNTRVRTSISLARNDETNGINNSIIYNHAEKSVLNDSYKKIASTPLYLPSQPNVPIRNVVAPMVAASDYAFRCLTRQYGADLTFTQMLHSKQLVQDTKFFHNHWDLYEYNDQLRQQQQSLVTASENLIFPVEQGSRSLSSNEDSPKQIVAEGDFPPCTAATQGPVIVQLAGHDVNLVTRAARCIIESTNGQVAGIDLNLGCPQTIARKGRYGAFLMEQDEGTVYTILKTLRQTVPPSVAISAKIRLPLDPSVQEDRIQRLCDTGVTFLTVHGRDLTENKTTVSNVHMDRLAAAVATARAANVPVIANGGIETLSDIDKLFTATGASAVMSSEALLERPTLFATAATNYEATTQSTTTTLIPWDRLFEEQLQSATVYLQWCRYAPPVPGVLSIQNGSFNIVRGHLFKFLYRYLQDHIDLRDNLASMGTFQRLEQAEVLLQTLRQRYQNLSQQEWDTLPSSRYPESTWYRRHWASGDNVRPRTKWNRSSNTISGQVVAVEQVSIDERKRQMRERIAKLQSQKNSAGATK